jgi:hypothetical protein
VYEELQAEGKLPMRVYLTIYHRELDRSDIPKPLAQNGLLEPSSCWVCVCLCVCPGCSPVMMECRHAGVSSRQDPCRRQPGRGDSRCERRHLTCVRRTPKLEVSIQLKPRCPRVCELCVTQALRKPYVGTEAKGMLIYSRPTLVSMVKKAHDLGYRLGE